MGNCFKKRYRNINVKNNKFVLETETNLLENKTQRKIKGKDKIPKGENKRRIIFINYYI